MQKRAIFGIFVLFGLALIYNFWPSPTASEPKAARISVPVVTTPQTTKSGSADESSFNDEVLSAKEKESTQSDSESMDAFRQWFSEESGRLEDMGPMSPEYLESLSNRAASLADAEQAELVKIARNLSEPAQKKILAVYMLSLGKSGTLQSLTDFIEAPLQAEPDADPHSPEDAKRVQEKSLKIMAIEALVEQAKTDPQARSLLERSMENIADPYLRNYAKRKLTELTH
ncbi:MAG: hypothetical protein KDD61_05380 [Bdellovibrionales bacterium]|nr:hypothetical protein [Bdellovibrionales bacterium]